MDVFCCIRLLLDFTLKRVELNALVCKSLIIVRFFCCCVKGSQRPSRNISVWIWCVFKEQTRSNSFIPAEYCGGYMQTFHFFPCGFTQLTNNKELLLDEVEHDIINYQNRVDFFFTVTSTKYQRQKMNICKRRHWGEITKFINSYERDSSIKWNLKGFCAKCYSL